MVESTYFFGCEERFRLLQIYNQYRSLFGGEETVVLATARLVEENGGTGQLVMRSSRGLDASIGGRAKAFFSGIYNPFSFREIAGVIRDFQPHVVHVHNLNPLFSASVLPKIRRMGLPIVMTVHNHFHTCPTADHLRGGMICELCVGGHELNCLLKNCRGSILESLGYAVRSRVARVFRLYTDNVTIVIALNEFSRKRMIGAGFDASRVVVLPNMIEIPARQADPSRGSHVVFSGRMCPEKGVTTLIRAAERVPEIPFRLLGGGDTLEENRRIAPANAELLGQVTADIVKQEYRNARFVVVPSLWFEGCPLVILEAMANGLPVVASRIGGLGELVEDGVTGLLFEAGNATELAERIAFLWSRPETCAKMGERARRKAEAHHSAAVHWEGLKTIYSSAMRRGSSRGT